jgi:ABC-2 type transport system ATP-binding protein
VPPRPKRPPKTGARAVADPGPPPPLPPDLVIPPKPPLPPIEDVAEAPEETQAVAVVDEGVVDEEEEDVAEVPPEPAIAGPDPEVLVADPEPEVLVADPEPEPEVAMTEPAPEITAAEPEVLEPVAPEHELAVSEDDPFAPAAEIVPEVLITASVDVDTAALVVKGVTKAFGETRAVDGIDLTVPAGIFYGLVGPNGAGKTTTLSMIAGLLRPDRGAIRVNGVDAASDPLGAKRQMGVLPDRLRTFDRLTGRQLLHYYGVLRGLPSAVVESRTNDLARAFDLSDALGRVVSDYSAGMVKKVMLAGAMIHSPRLLVLDEPFEAVDPVSSAIILEILKTYVAHGGTVILSSHGMDLVERVCSRVAVIVAGQVLAEGTVGEVRGELTLEQRFIELAGGLSDVEGLEWLHTFSD